VAAMVRTFDEAVELARTAVRERSGLRALERLRTALTAPSNLSS